ncbi:MAG TPA: prephenate dehydrogenase [Burkholderiaceae bacterium]|nr:prephenate dehydrogenase [Burkholderiaceae bacterium]
MAFPDSAGPKSVINPRTPIDVLAVVGVGLIGGSFAAALKRRSGVKRVLGVGRERAHLLQAQRLGLIDEIVTLAEAVARANLLFLAIPVGAMRSVFQQIRPHLHDNLLITDAGSTKQDVVTAAQEVLQERIGQFIPGHPIAGSEASGPEAADSLLYLGRTVVLTVLPQNNTSDRDFLRSVWELCGARVVVMSASRHDAAMAAVSHMPHFLASVFMGAMASSAEAESRMALAGSGFSDFTRIAAGSPEVWRDIFLANRSALLEELANFRQALEDAEHSLKVEDEQALYKFLEKAALARRFWGSRSGLT